MAKRFCVSYKDMRESQYDGDAFSTYTFAKESDRDAMVADLRSANSPWGNEAVRIFTHEQELPDVWYAGEEE